MRMLYAALAVALAVSPSCKSRSEPANKAAAPTKNLDACSFLTEADASDVLGAPVKLARAELDVCRIKISADVSALVQVRGATDLWDGLHKEGPVPTRVDGLGDAAGWTDKTNGGTDMLTKLYVVRNGKTLSITVSGPGVNDDAMKAKIEALAAKAVPRM